MDRNIYDMLNDGNFDSEEYNEEMYIDENINDIERKKIKKYILGNEVKNRKVLKGIVVSAILVIIVGITSIPAVADHLPFISKIYETLGLKEKYLSYNNYIGKTFKQNGIKVTIDNIVGSKNKVIITTKVEGEDGVQIEQLMRVKVQCGINKIEDIEPRPKFCMRDGTSILNILTLESSVGYPEKGDLKIKIDYGDKFYDTFSFPVDFSKAFLSTSEIDVNKYVTELDLNIKKVESNVLGTSIIAEKGENANEHILPSSILFKVDEKFYISENCEEMNNKDMKFTFEGVKYNDIKDAEDIRIIPIVPNVKEEELVKMIRGYKEKCIEEEKIKYNKIMEFNDGTIGEIYKVERENDTVKLYYRGKTEKHNLLMTSAIHMALIDKEYNFLPYAGTYYKNGHGYVAEFKGIKEDETVTVSTDLSATLIDKYTIGEEVKIK